MKRYARRRADVCGLKAEQVDIVTDSRERGSFTVEESRVIDRVRAGGKAHPHQLSND
ncbi:MAG: hypothetical protein R6X13_08745 [bacterium]